MEAPLHLVVVVVVCLEMSSSPSSRSKGSLVAALLERVETLPPLRIRRRFAVTMPLKLILPISLSAVAIVSGSGTMFGSSIQSVKRLVVALVAGVCVMWMERKVVAAVVSEGQMCGSGILP